MTHPILHRVETRVPRREPLGPLIVKVWPVAENNPARIGVVRDVWVNQVVRIVGHADLRFEPVFRPIRVPVIVNGNLVADGVPPPQNQLCAMVSGGTEEHLRTVGIDREQAGEAQ